MKTFCKPLQKCTWGGENLQWLCEWENGLVRSVSGSWIIYYCVTVNEEYCIGDGGSVWQYLLHIRQISMEMSK